MGTDRFESLTDEQRHSLRLVARGFTSKSIANPLGLHQRAIDQRLDRARRILGESDRYAAARAFADYEASMSTYDRVIRVTPSLVSPDAKPEIDAATWETRKPSFPEVVHEAPASAPWDYDFRQDAPTNTGKHNAYSPIQRIALTIAVIAGFVISIVAAPALLDSFHRLANFIRPTH